MASALKQVSATGPVTDVADGSVYVKSVTLTAAAVAASVTLDDSTAGAGADLLTLKAPIEQTVTWRCGDHQGALFATRVHATITGAGALVSVEYGRS